LLAPLLALGASLSWGTADFLGGLKSRLFSPLAVMAVSQPFGLVALGIAVAARGSAPPGAEVAWACLSAVLGTLGLAAFYRGLAVGSMSVVAPIAAVAAGIPVAWGVAISGDRLSGLQAIGIVAAIGGAVVAALERDAGGARIAAGVGWAALAMLGFGGYFVPLHAAAAHDWLWPAFLFRCTSVPLVWLLLYARRGRVRGTRSQLVPLATVGLLDTGANALFAAASTRHGLLSVVSVLASLYPVVTVLLARHLLGERVQRTQDFGVAITLVGVVLITAG
jgi:drug/metabolite transporter (DMT)-like permease